MKQLMIGNQAVAAGLYDGGLHVVSSYPGTPSTEITEFCRNIMTSTASGRPTKRLQWKLPSARALRVQERRVQ